MQFYGIKRLVYRCVRFLCSLTPLRRKVVASSFRGKNYSDNTRYIVEKLHELDPQLKIIWLKDSRYEYEVPDYIRIVYAWPRSHGIRRFYEYSTAAIILDTHTIDSCFKKRKGQQFILTWHESVGIKKVELDNNFASNIASAEMKTKNTVEQADLFISSSDFLTKQYHHSFGRWDGIWKCGCPKNDMLVKKNPEEIDMVRKKIRNFWGLDNECKVITYAPTHRDYAERSNMSYYDIGGERILSAFEKLFNTKKCRILFRLHPEVSKFSEDFFQKDKSFFLNATYYPNIQELIMGSDAFISDYSSCIFDAALMDIPCFIFAKDFNRYKEERGTVFETLEELPFPYARTKSELESCILNFNYEQYRREWMEFSKKMGIYETGHAAEDIAMYILNSI